MRTHYAVMVQITAERVLDAPIIHPGLSPSPGTNINGPSLIRVPSWVDRPLGRYYLYFADHKGERIRLAFADALEGPWSLHPPGALSLLDSSFPSEPPSVPEGIDPAALAEPRAPGVPSLLDDASIPHIASPEVVVDVEGRRIRLYYHGLHSFGVQVTRAAVSRDGLHFEPRDEILSRPYLRMMRHSGVWYGLAMPGQLYRSTDGLSAFEAGPKRFADDMRHCALLRRGETLAVFWTRVGDAPERILFSTIALGPDWQQWRESEPVELLRPERPWEGAGQPLEPSVRSAVDHPVNQLRDPAIFEEEGRCYLLYATAGESGIGLARLDVTT